MANVSSTGGISTFDVTSIVNSLMQIENIPMTKLQSQKSSVDASISSWGAIKSSFASLADTLSFSTLSKKSSVSGTSVSASVSSTAQLGNFDISVSSLAKSQVLVSQGAASKTDALTTSSSTVSFSFGTITGGTLTNGKWSGATFSTEKTANVSISAGASLQDIASSINAAGIGVSAQIVNDGSAWRLSLSGETGKNASMSISVSGDSSLSSLISNNPAGTQNLTENKTAQDASLSVNGIALTRHSNTVSDFADGVSVKLTAVGDSTVTVENDTDATKNRISDMVSKWNSTNSLARGKTAKGGELQGDQGLLQANYGFRNAVGATFDSGTFTRLSQIGISMAKDGTVSFDSSKYDAAISKDATSVNSLLAKFSEKARTASDAVVGTGGTIESRLKSLNQKSDSIVKQEENLQRRLDQLRSQYTTQYTALNSYMNNMSSLYGIVSNLGGN